LRWIWLLSVAPFLVPAGLLLAPAEATRPFALSECVWECDRDDLRVVLPETADGFERKVELLVEDTKMLVRASAITLRLSADRAGVHVQTAALSLGPSCRFVLPQTTELVGDGSLRLLPEGSCAGIPSKKVRLVFTVDRPAEVALDAYGVRSGNPYYKALSVMFDGAKTFPKGTYELPPPEPMSRLALLGALWRGPFGEWSIPGLLLAAGVLLLCAGVALAKERLVWAGTTGFAALCIAYAVLVPPLQAPDEPDHLLTFGRTASNLSFGKRLLFYANDLHFERIKYRADEKFTVADLEVNRYTTWAGHVSHLSNGRSLLTDALWSWGGLGRHLGKADPWVTIMVLRLLNGLIATAAVLWGLLLLTRGGRRADQIPVEAFLVALALIPTLAFFTMHVSNYAFVIAGYLLQASALPLLLDPKPWSKTTAFTLGVGVGLSLAGGRVGLLTPVFWGPLLTAHFLYQDPKATVREGYTRLVVMALGFASVLAFTHLVSGASLARNPLLAGFGQIPAEVGTKLGVLGLAACLCLPLLRFVKVPRWTWRRGPTLVASVVLAGLYLHTAFGVHHAVPDIEGASRVSLTAYLRYVEQAFALFMGLGPSDGYIVKTFFGGYGWLEAPIRDEVLALIRFLPALGIALAFFRVSFAKTDLRPTHTLICLLALAGYLASLAAGSYRLANNLHGRYLCGFFIFYMVFGVTLLFRSLRLNGRWFVPGLAGLQAYGLAHVILRYF
jgi:hypothetical protein